MTPTNLDQEILKVAREVLHKREAGGWLGPNEVLAISKAVLERFGQAPAVQQEPVAYAIFAENGNIRIWATEPQHVKRIAEEKGLSLVELYTHPAPAEVREPLSDDWILSRCNQTWVYETAKQWVRATEAAHGITGSKK